MRTGDDAALERRALLCCSVLYREVRHLAAGHWPRAELLPLNSMLHMHPERLVERLDAALANDLPRPQRTVLVYGDCCPAMAAYESLPGVARTRCINCPDLVLGREAYRRLEHEGVFFLLPEWTARWRRVFGLELGLDRDNLRGLFSDMHRRLVYLDTRILPVPLEVLRDCSEFLGLPFEVAHTPLDFLRAAIDDAWLRTKPPTPPP